MKNQQTAHQFEKRENKDRNRNKWLNKLWEIQVKNVRVNKWHLLCLYAYLLSPYMGDTVWNVWVFLFMLNGLHSGINKGKNWKKKNQFPHLET